jgi:hypothetical protein
MATIYLTKSEKKELINKGTITIERYNRLPCPNSSIIHGIGTKYIFDKIDYKWVYGDVDSYIIEKNECWQESNRV